MNTNKIVPYLKVMALLFSLIFSACEQRRQTTVITQPGKITANDVCHVCGMNISEFPGPKGQAFIKHRDTPLKFCSTVDMFGWLLQPDTPAILETAYVHDMGASPDWRHPDDEHYIDVKSAWYVVSKTLTGAMGPTLASFREQQAARDFTTKYGGTIIKYADIDLDLILKLQLAHTHDQNQFLRE